MGVSVPNQQLLIRRDRLEKQSIQTFYKHLKVFGGKNENLEKNVDKNGASAALVSASRGRHGFKCIF